MRGIHVSQSLAGKALKAAYSAAVAFLGMLTMVLVGSSTFGDITDGQWVAAILFALTAAGGTFGLAGWSGPNVNGNTTSGPK